MTNRQRQSIRSRLQGPPRHIDLNQEADEQDFWLMIIAIFGSALFGILLSGAHTL